MDPAEPRMAELMTPEYVAGLFDGEGYVTIDVSTHRSGRKYHRVIVSIANTDRRPLDKLLSQYGGFLTNQPSKGKRAWRWSTSNKTAIEFLKNIYPHLIIKKEQASVAILYGTRHGGYKGRSLSVSEIEDREMLRHAILRLRQA